jgi:pyruvate dehydrogenase E2 component (dihydrolipoamide acetyltransferase)
MRVSPLAKKIALEQNIDLNKITGTGPHGRIIKKDVLQTTKVTGDIETVSIPQSPEPRKIDNSTQDSLKDKTIPVSKMRSIIAKRLLESKNTIPHFYLQKEINALPLKNARVAINLKLAQLNKENVTKISINDLILKACAETIKLVPEINSSWEENEIRYHGGIHLAFGVAVEDGLVTPVVRNADQLSLEGLSFEAKGLISKARTKKLMPDEMSGSTFTVSNLGMFGIDFFSGIINPPNAAILSIGASVKKAVVDETGNIQAGETMILGLSCDHRLVDGAIGANFLKFLAETLENPASMLV